MSKIEITQLYESNDCETCGGGYADGYYVTIDGEQFGDYEPIAGCIDSRHFELDQVLTDLLRHFGHKVEIS